MKKILLIFIMMLFLCACSSKQNESEKETKETKEVYIGDEPFILDETTITIDSHYCSGFLDDNYDFYIYFKLKNNSLNSKEYTISNVQLIKEETNVKYNTYYDKSIALNAELTSTIKFESTIPSNIKDDNYNLSFTLNSNKIIVYLYEKPEEPKGPWTVNYIVDNNIVHSVTVEDKQTLKEYIYASPDHLYYYTFPYSMSITSDMDLHGSQKETLYYSTSTSDKYSFVTRVVYLNSDLKVWIPRSHDGKEMAVGAYAFSSATRLEEIYVPINVRQLYSSSFANIGNVKVYYEGSKEQWESLFYDSVTYPTNIFYNSRIPY